MAKPSPREIKAVASVLDPELSEEAKDMAVEVIEALDKVRDDKDQWIVVARPLADGPYVSVGSWTTKRQAMRATQSLVSAHVRQTPGVGMMVMPMYHPAWLDTLA